ncbi:hypothetical protein AMTR_s00037p00210010 [Amborella trichopoda]|uniref:Uncharacterized protein n=1 Tax=Amborella trichopoda TaxID=13333 RepID=U5D4M1_AMBTC|nr:hypothetical protein AMTR_s00037p00210010 [Amborella trichopoda]
MSVSSTALLTRGRRAEEVNVVEVMHAKLHVPQHCIRWQRKIRGLAQRIRQAHRWLDHTKTFWRNHMDSVKKQAREYMDQLKGLGANLDYIVVAKHFFILLE